MKQGFSRFIRDERGATAIEYGLIAGLIALGIFVGAQSLGNNLSSTFQAIGSRVLALVTPAGG
ncbi:Flp family type IVb pilin [Cupriavidus gilardii]|uniref:Flp family type IVb pilin n=1 Tax=Cupriavidus gilardii TaxID=82541 RepID=UPI0015746EEA|nr:Flp family type IVb pilin [Cupriavidus gilardii]MBO4122700.1 Flp family type IVb pilin [Cupriavidus gilardii]MCG5262407.1 Flp family type IVb pilin [Cupriavidus gilardii]MDF9431336.1 Flp family type IVb pilin [Cupriavidus gilardii]NSX02802.1 Flp family type IVb pilin [Cupriavidus gilardii]